MREKCMRSNTYPKRRLEHYSQLPDVSTKGTVRSPRQHFRCGCPPIFAGTDPSTWKASHSSRRWFLMLLKLKRNRKFEIICVLSNWEQGPKLLGI